MVHRGVWKGGHAPSEIRMLIFSLNRYRICYIQSNFQHVFFWGGVGSSNFASDPIILSGVPPQQIPGYAPELVHRNFTSYCGGSRQEQLTMI